MENILQEIIVKLKEYTILFKNQRPIQYGVIIIYLLLWLFSSGSLTTTIWVGVGVGLGWMIGRSEEKE